MKEWYTNTELADLALPGFPCTPRGVANWFKLRNYDMLYPHKVRRRKEQGGGLERHISLLPRGVQVFLQVRGLRTAKAADPEAIMKEAYAGVATLPPPPVNEKGELRRAAILLILNFWDIFRSRASLPSEIARNLFVVMYRNNRIEGMPDWVRVALTTNGGKERTFCVNTMRNWEKLRNEGKFFELSGDYGNRRGTGVLDTAEDGKVSEFLAARIVAQPDLTADHLRDMTIANFGKTLDTVSPKTGSVKTVSMPSLKSFQRWVKAWRDAHQDALMKMTDPDSWKNKRRFSGRNMNAWVSRPNQLWEIDASPADVLLLDGRYSIYAVVDIYTRRMMVSVTKTPKTSAVLALVRRAILTWGVPDILRTDNGADFVSYEFKRAMSALAIHQDITDPFSPEQKGSVERAIGTLQRGLMPLLPGYVGHNVADRKKIEARKSFAKRLGEKDQDIFCVELTHAELSEKINHWVEHKYHHNPHAGINDKTPFQMIAEWNGPIRTINNERVLDLLLAPIVGKDGIRTVTKFGIQADKAYFMHPDLMVGDTVLCRYDPADMGRIYVYSDDGREFICVAECPERLGVNPGEAVRAVREAQNERLKQEVEPLQREIRSMKSRDMVNDVLRVAAENAENVMAFPNRVEAYTTPAIEAAEEALQPTMPYQPEAQQSTAEHSAMHQKITEEIEMAQATVVQMPETARDRYRWYRDTQQRADRGEYVPPDDMRRMVVYEQSDECKAQVKMFEEWGLDWLMA